MKKTLIIILLIAIAVFLVYKYSAKESGVDENSNDIVLLNEAKVGQITQEVKEGKAVLLDVRTSQERSEDGYIEISTHFDLARLQAGELPDIPKDTKIYAHCKGGTRAGKAKEILEQNGFTDVSNIGGLVDWEEFGGEVSR